MGKLRRNSKKNTNVERTSTMISKEITPHKEATTTYYGSNTSSYRKYTKAEFEATITKLVEQGYIIGAPVITAWDRKGHIIGFIPNDVLENRLLKVDDPDIIQVAYEDGVIPQVFYNTRDLKLVTKE
jgi:hypothetical protein